jgi:hypothetical protein
MSIANAGDVQRLIWVEELVLAGHKLRDVPGTFEAVESFEAAIADLDNGRWNWRTINSIMQAHRVVNGKDSSC